MHSHKGRPAPVHFKDGGRIRAIKTWMGCSCKGSKEYNERAGGQATLRVVGDEIRHSESETTIEAPRCGSGISRPTSIGVVLVPVIRLEREERAKTA